MKCPRFYILMAKKVPTLVHDTTETMVKVPGKRGKGSYRTVSTVSNKLEVQDHYPVVSEPGGEYVTHVTPKEGTGRSIAKELVAIVRERNIKIRGVGCDGCAVNCGIHNGFIRWVELELGYPVQHIVCILHFNELFLHHVFDDADGVSSGPGLLWFYFILYNRRFINSDKLSGPVGSTLAGEIWREPVVNFKPVSGKMSPLRDEVKNDLSRDQLLAYRWGLAIQSGERFDKILTFEEGFRGGLRRLLWKFLCSLCLSLLFYRCCTR